MDNWYTAKLGDLLVYYWVNLKEEMLCFGGSTHIVQASVLNPHV